MHENDIRVTRKCLYIYEHNGTVFNCVYKLLMLFDFLLRFWLSFNMGELHFYSIKRRLSIQSLLHVDIHKTIIYKIYSVSAIELFNNTFSLRR